MARSTVFYFNIADKWKKQRLGMAVSGVQKPFFRI
jgi:hypothetical protein